VSGKRRKQQRSRGRRPLTSPPAPPAVERDPQPAAGATAAAAATTPAPATASRPAVAPSRPATGARFASNVSGPRRAAAATSVTGTIDIDERVPYFSRDLRRILATASIMIVLIIVGSLLLH
jgi:hypothetical protein